MASMFSPRLDPEERTDLLQSNLPFPVVGIGASAGGLEALLRFFERVPEESGMAYVVILHLSPKHESNAAAILQRVTKLPVMQITGSTPIQADHVYVIAPAADLSMNDNHLEPSPRGDAGGPHAAIDIFFRTMAHVHGNRAICVVMSGTGSDGSVGITRIKEQGGVTIAQMPGDALHDDMPRAAIATGMVDIVLAAADMPQRLMELWSNAQRIQLPGSEHIAPFAQTPESAPKALTDDAALQEVMALLRSYTHHDFRHYKLATMLRRIERRLQVNGLPDLPSYRDFLQAHPKEAEPLLQDMLISVTNFFRDHAAFHALEHEIIPKLFENKAPGEQVRVWSAGCATGEESYSLSMLLRERLETHAPASSVQIFATDIDQRAIAIARRGSYSSAIAADVSPPRLQQFFIREQERYRIAGVVREQILFAAHNLLSDPPFSRLDLICCRNLLIYLDRKAQTSALEMFHYALKPGGYLFLGTSESADAAGSLFIPLDKKNRLFRANSAALPVRSSAFLRELIVERLTPAQSVGQVSKAQRPATAELHDLALEKFSPPSVLIDAQYDVLHLSPNAGRFLERGSGAPSNNLLSNVRPDIRLELRTALFKASQSGSSVKSKLALDPADGRKALLQISVHPFQQADDAPALTLVVFEEMDADGVNPADAAPDAARGLLVSKLEEEVQQLKLHLQETLERSGISTEELKASNEELQAINEELRSATEELETSKEELQSINEELVTVNYELKMKVEEREQINDDLQNLISSSEIATVFVDSGMRVKRYTPHAGKLFNLIPSDVGRSLLDITNRLHYSELADDAAAVFRDLRVIERRVSTSDGQHFFARILPYRTADNKIEGAVLTFFDVTELQHARERVLAGEERLRVVAATTKDYAIITTDENGAIATWNTGAARVFGYSDEEIIGRSIAEIFTRQDRINGVPEEEMRLALETGRAEDDRWHQRKDGSTFFCSGVMTLLDSGVGQGFVKIGRDLTGSKQQQLAQENLLLREKQTSLSARTANELKDKFLAVMSHELKQPLNLISVNAELLTRLPEVKEIPSAARIGVTIQRAVGSQTKIINDLLDLSRVRTGKLHLDLQILELDEIVRSFARAASDDLARKSITLEVLGANSVRCCGDRVRVEQIVWNLLGNAIKFTSEGGHISIWLGRDDEFAKLTIADNGCGVAAEFLPHIFGMFSQDVSLVVPGEGGLGIGLALVQEITVAHGGRVEVTSAGVGQGTSFSVWLPAEAVVGANQTIEDNSGASLNGRRVLLVEDDTDSSEAFAILLSLEGAKVDVASNGNAALELLKDRDYDFMISDLGLPEMDGYSLIAEVRRRARTENLRALAMSGYGRAADIQKALHAGFNAHVPKPASIDEIKAAIGKL